MFTQPFIQVQIKDKHQSSASLAIVRGIHRWPVNSPNKWPVTRKMFPFDDVIMISRPNVATEASINHTLHKILKNLKVTILREHNFKPWIILLEHSYYHIEFETEWLPFGRWHFQINFHGEYCCFFTQILLEFVPTGSIKKWANTGANNGLAPNRPMMAYLWWKLSIRNMFWIKKHSARSPQNILK